MTQTLTVTAGKFWRDKVRGGVVLRFPSGFTARVRGVQPDVLLTTAKIPDQLTPIIAGIMDGSKSMESMDTIEALRASTELVNAICRAAMVEPHIVDEPQADDEIGLDDLEWPDKQFLFGTVGATTRGLERFRDEQARDVDAVDAAEGHAAPGEPDPEPAAVGEGDVGV